VALGLAARSGTALATVWPLVSNPEYEAVAPQIAAHAEQAVALKIADFRAHSDAKSVLTTVKVRRGEDRHKEIVEEARVQGSELIVLRQCAPRSLFSSFLVSEISASEIVALGSCHVLMVPRGARMWNNGIVLAVDTSQQDRQIVAIAFHIALQWHLPLHLVIVITDETPREEALVFAKSLRHQAEQSGVTADCEIRSGNPVTEILSSVAETHSDLIIVGYRGKSQKIRSPMSDWKRKVLRLSKYPVLVARA
jgi:hypothetical protein